MNKLIDDQSMKLTGPLSANYSSKMRSTKLFVQRFSHNKGAVAGFVIICFVILIALFADNIAPYNPDALGSEPFSPPSKTYYFGTDDLGRDVFSGVLFGARTSLIVGITSALISLLVGIIIGAVAGYFGGGLNDFLMRVTDIFLVIPRFFLAIIIVAFYGSGVGKLIFVIGILSWPTIARLVRSQFLWLKEQEFVEAARSGGMKNWSIIVGEILPNAIPPAIVVGSLEVARAILMEAGLSFLGLGDPNVISWGTMLRDAHSFLRRAPWMALFPGLAISLVVLVINLIGDGLNDALNPRSQEM